MTDDSPTTGTTPQPDSSETGDEAPAPESERGSDATDGEPVAGRTASRRRFLARTGLGMALIGLGAAGAETVRAVATPATPPRTRHTAAAALRIDDVTVVDPGDGSARPARSIVIEQGRIRAVIATSSTATETSMRVVDGGGRYAVPGYNDMHTHVLQTPNPELGFGLMLSQGITGIRQMQGSKRMLSLRAEDRLGLNETAPELLQIPGELLLPFNATTVDDARREIARQWDQGADFIKMILTDDEIFFAAIEAAHGQGLRICGHLPPTVRIDDATQAHFDCLEHLGTGSSVFLTLSSEARALWSQQPDSLPFPSWLTRVPFSFEVFDTFLKDHYLGPATNTTDADQLAFLERAFVTYSTDRAAELGQTFADQQIWNCPTLVGIRSKYRLDDPEYHDDPWLDRLPDAERTRQLADIESFSSTPPEDLEIFHQYYDRVLETIGIWAGEGAPIMTGTDNNGRGTGNTLALEFRELGRAGLSPLDVLRATTTAPARYLGRGHTMGRIIPGADANLLLLDENPLLAIENLSTISLVVRDGHDTPVTELTDRVETLLAGQAG